MKHTVSAIIAACTAMLLTSGVVAWATAAPEPAETAVALETSAHLDSVITAQLSQVKRRLQKP
jgi:hypothetical protein